MTYPFERAAMQNDPMPEGLTGAEQILYQGLALLYSRYRSGQLSREKRRSLSVGLSNSSSSARPGNRWPNDGARWNRA